MKPEFFICNHCGNIVAMVQDAGVPVFCCGEKMQQLTPGSTDAAEEKHVPVYRVEDGLVTVTVGEAAHPMTPEHYISWICIQTAQGVQYKTLTPDDEPKASFALCCGDRVEAAYAYCNKHSLWKK